MEYRGDQRDLSALIDQYGNCVLHTAYHYLKEKQLAEDVFQNVFLAAYLKMDTFHGDSSIKTWLIRITINQCKDVLKSAYQKQVNVGLEEVACISESAEQIALENIENERLYQSVMALKPDYREVILLRYYHQLAPGEIAQVLQLSNGTIRTRLSRATATLRKILT
ncbi:MAG TPA: hypothetical protein DCY74_08470 [Clostridiales bacterium]|jgi:RNA polymerase sigma-70 factor (ECF subfamily)|nr:hypothetical protein [Clostridiales bacterium]HBE14190.1 hypothetical protein [Clostridiales bacterium]HCG35607.1 hypothetical protein [Clostridiales bacterium]